MTSDELIHEWHMRVYGMQTAHYDAATHLERLNLSFGIPVIILSTIVGTTIFATVAKTGSIRTQIIVGLFSVAAAVLASLQTFLRYSERAEKHRVAGTKYASLKAELEMISVVRPATDQQMKEFLDAFRVKWTTVREESPTVPRRIFAKTTARLKSEKE